MFVEKVINYCLSKNKSYIEYPFGNIPICFKVNKKIFAEVYPEDNDYKITLKCDPTLAEVYRIKYKNKIVKGYHCPAMQAIYWNTVYLDKNIEDDVIYEMIDHSYEEVVKGFPKKVQKDLLNDKELCYD